MTKYSFDNAWIQARQRLTALEGWLDSGTIRHLSERGVGPGWRCLEVGAGGGSIAEWLCERVGPEGSVLATDLDTRFVEAVAIGRSNLECRRHDVVTDALPVGEFDLAHTRLMLGHLPERDKALDRIIGALKPGGWLLVEEMDFGSIAVDPHCGEETATLFGKAIAGHHRVVMRRGFDIYYGRRVLGDLRRRGLGEIGTEGRSFCWNGGSVGAEAWKLTIEQLREQMIASGEITAEEIEAVTRLLDDPAFAHLSQVTVAAWGRKPVA